MPMQPSQGLAAQAHVNRARNKVKELVENRTVYERHDAELSIYDTFEPASEVLLNAEEILYCGMISGKKTLHGKNHYETSFLPHESFVMAPGESIHIDFPEAKLNQPTSCLTLGISRERLRRVCDQLNHQAPAPSELGEWQFERQSVLHTFHTEATQLLLARIVDCFLQHDSDRDLVLNLGVTELLARMLRQQGKDFLFACMSKDPTRSGMTAAVAYIEHHLSDPIDIDSLCKVACMSRSKLYLQFKNLLGSGPMEYLHHRRLERAKELICQGKSITEACFTVGYINASHFSRRFLQQYGVSPRHFQKKSISKTNR